VETRWSGANARYAPSDPMPSDLLPSDPDWAGGTVYTDVRERSAAASAETLWHVVAGIGGDRGWYSFPLGWRARGILDRLVGGVGLRRGRRDADRLKVGDALDWWRVEEVDDLELIRLRAEMRLPGLAWLELRVERDDAGRTVFRQRAIFAPRGLAGQAYWLAIKPFHGIVFGGMQQGIAQAAARVERGGAPPRWRPSGDRVPSGKLGA
jgi:hypothetical protein